MENNPILLLFAHPTIHLSKVNKQFLKQIAHIEGVKVNNLYQQYPDFYIDVEFEQSLLHSADMLVIQFPFYWYSVPAIIKEWIDQILKPGFAYGGANKLTNKRVQLVVSTGSPIESYQNQGEHIWSVEDFLKPLQQTFRYCKMQYLTPFITYNAANITQQQLELRAAEYANLLSQFVTEMNAFGTNGLNSDE